MSVTGTQTEGKTVETVKTSVVAGGWGRGGMIRQNTEDFQGQENTLWDTITVDTYIIIHLFKPMECTTPRVNSDVNYILWVIMIC